MAKIKLSTPIYSYADADVIDMVSDLSSTIDNLTERISALEARACDLEVNNIKKIIGYRVNVRRSR
ncbi:MAG: hypothetical protein LIO71_03260 [Ruminococcus sp.]|nr:hypothetical protein [Ruminococcus sp.]